MKGRPPIEEGTRRDHNGKTQVFSRLGISGKYGRWISENRYNQLLSQQGEPNEPINEPSPPSESLEKDNMQETPEKIPEKIPEDTPNKNSGPFNGLDAGSSLFSEMEDMKSILEDSSLEAASEEFESYKNEGAEGESSAPIGGDGLLSIIDMAGSRIAAFALQRFNVSDQGYEEFKLTPSERRELEAVADECAKSIKWSDNPWTNFSLAYIMLVATKVSPKKKDKKQAKKEVENGTD